MDAKTYISEILGFYKYKVDNNQCALDELEQAAHVVENNIDSNASIRVIANYFGKPESHVRNTIARNIMPKPKRGITYSFKHFLKIAPKSWLKTK